jgi:hypothetical protein
MKTNKALALAAIALGGYTLYRVGRALPNVPGVAAAGDVIGAVGNFGSAVGKGADMLAARPDDIIPALVNVASGIFDDIAGRAVNMVSDMTGAPRGLRNNNPGNIRDFGIAWRGRVGTDNNPGGPFVVFDTMDNGARALMLNLNSRARDVGGVIGQTTVADVINAWAPGSDGNDPASYISTVERVAGVSAQTIVDPRNAEQMAALAIAITAMENGSGAVNSYAPALATRDYWLAAWEAAGLRGA